MKGVVGIWRPHFFMIPTGGYEMWLSVDLKYSNLVFLLHIIVILKSITFHYWGNLFFKMFIFGDRGQLQ